MEHLYLSVDGGGSKLITVLYDGNFRKLATAKSGPVNENFTDKKDVSYHMEENIRRCLSGIGRESVLDQVSIAMPGPWERYVDFLSAYCTVRSVVNHPEGYVSLLAGIGRRKGVVSLAGTGSGAFYVNREDWRHLGGWGSWLGDEGSGFDIGRKGIAAAIRAAEEREPETGLKDRVFGQIPGFTGTNYHVLLDYIYQAPSPRRLIASFSRVVSDCAWNGDPAAIEIIREAGRENARQVLALLKRENLTEDLTVVIAGGAWKGHPAMLDAFRLCLLEQQPGLSVRIPYFDPVMGPVLDRALDQNETLDSGCLAFLQQEFSEFLYRIPEGPERKEDSY